MDVDDFNFQGHNLIRNITTLKVIKETILPIKAPPTVRSLTSIYPSRKYLHLEVDLTSTATETIRIASTLEKLKRSLPE